MKSRITAAVLALFLGFIGVHRFYLGQSGLGIFYALSTIFTITVPVLRIPLGALLGVIDAVMFFLMSDEEFDKRYNAGQPDRRRQSRDRRDRTPKGRRRDDRQQARRPAPVSRSKKKNPFKMSGQKKLEAYELKEAIADLKQSLTIYEEDSEVHYMLARAHSLSEEADEAYYHLSRAVQYGFKDLDKIKTDESLAFLRVHKDFGAFEASGYTRLKAPSPSNRQVNDPKLLAQLERLAEMRRQGLITEQDYIVERQRIERKQ